VHSITVDVGEHTRQTVLYFYFRYGYKYEFYEATKTDPCQILTRLDFSNILIY